MRAILITILFLSFSGQCFSQDPVSDEATFEERYARNIKKSRINGVYIPKNLNEALAEIVALSTIESLEKFKMGKEEEVARKLHFGLGRWMIYNWNFYEGSRFSHHLKEMGLAHPDDMAQLIIVTLHRHLNKKDLGTPELIEKYAVAREKERQESIKVLKQETRKRQND